MAANIEEIAIYRTRTAADRRETTGHKPWNGCNNQEIRALRSNALKQRKKLTGLA